MKQPLIRIRLSLGAVVAAEVLAAATMAALMATGVATSIAAGVAVLAGVAVCMVTVSGLTAWQWGELGWRWTR